MTRRIIIDVHQNVSDHVIWLQNGYNWVQSFPRSPYLVDIYTGRLNTNEIYQRAIIQGHGFDNITRTFPVQIGEVLEIVWQNQGTFTNGGLDAHPFHAHGRHFYDIGGGDGQYNATANEERLKSSCPIQRDTSLLYRYRSFWVAGLAVQSDGCWRVDVPLPCPSTYGHGHADCLLFGDQSDVMTQSGPVDGGYLTYGGSAYGNTAHSPVVRRYFNSGTWSQIHE